jgi:eukaryotic-like serine/threonine-protein kinase
MNTKLVQGQVFISPAWLPLTAGLRAVVEDNEPLHICAFSPDGTSFVTGSAATTVRHYDTASLQPIGMPILLEGKYLTVVGFSHDGKTLLIGIQSNGSDPAQLRRFDAVTHKPLGGPLLHPNAVSGVANSPDGRTIATTSADPLVRFWDLSTGRPCRSPLMHPEGTRVDSVSWTSDGRFMLVDSWAGTTGTEPAAAYIWDLQKDEPQPRFVLQHEGGVNQVAIAPDGNSALTVDNDHTVRLWDVTNGRPVGSPMIHPARVDTAHFSPDGSVVVTASRDGIARTWDAATGHPLVGSIPAAAPGAGDLALHPNGKTMLMVSGDRKGHGSGWLWECPRAPGRFPERMAEVLSKGSVISDARANHRRQLTVAHSPGREIALVATDPALARLRDAVDGQPMGRPMWHPFAAVGATSYSPVGNVVATSFLDGTIA